MVSIRGLFHVLVLHVDAMAPAQALMREISGGRREIPPGLVALFRRYRRRIPALPGMWRIDVLQRLMGEEATSQDVDMDDNDAYDDEYYDDDDGLEANQNASGKKYVGGEKRKSVAAPPWATLLLSLAAAVGGGNGNNVAVVVFLLAIVIISPLFMVVVGGKRVGSEGGSWCDQPVATLLLVDGLLLLVGTVAGGGFQTNRQRFGALAGKWIFPTAFFGFVAHVALVMGLLAAIARVDRVGGTQGEAGSSEARCSSGTFAWGVFFLVVDLFCLAAPPVVWCARCWDKVVNSVPALVMPDEEQRRDGDIVDVEMNDR